MEGKYKFDEGKYKNTFAEMFGTGAFDKGMAEAALLGSSTAQAKFAEQLYTARLQAARAAASGGGRGRRSGGGGGGGSSSPTAKADDLVDKWRNEKQQENAGALNYYNQKQSSKLNEGRSVARRKVEDVMGGLPTVRNDKKLTEWDKMKMFGG